MEIWNEILGNQVLVCSVAGWTVAQVLKTIIDVVLNRSFNPERLFGSGGMPSSHSATVCALTTASGLKYGVGSFEFAISFVVAMVVMYDAMGVRRETGPGGNKNASGRWKKVSCCFHKSGGGRSGSGF